MKLPIEIISTLPFAEIKSQTNEGLSSTNNGAPIFITVPYENIPTVGSTFKMTISHANTYSNYAPQTYSVIVSNVIYPTPDMILTRSLMKYLSTKFYLNSISTESFLNSVSTASFLNSVSTESYLNSVSTGSYLKSISLNNVPSIPISTLTNNSSSNDSSTKIIIGVVIGSLGGILVATAAIWWFTRRPSQATNGLDTEQAAQKDSSGPFLIRPKFGQIIHKNSFIDVNSNANVPGTDLGVVRRI